MDGQNADIILYNCFSDPMGQAALEVLAELAYMNETTYVDNNPHGTAFHEGRRSLYLDIVRHIKTQEERNRGREQQHHFADDQHGEPAGDTASADAADDASGNEPWWRRFVPGE